MAFVKFNRLQGIDLKGISAKPFCRSAAQRNGQRRNGKMVQAYPRILRTFPAIRKRCAKTRKR
ncbi:hypothetical protein KCP71_04795 [Salmonella enterica subsp. enterica]|nr:hypothetical protein KCP71_04795 [Salmonella enterica subsp. enterica]